MITYSGRPWFVYVIPPEERITGPVKITGEFKTFIIVDKLK